MSIDLAFCKKHLRIDGTDDDDVLAAYLATAIEEVTDATGIALSDDVPERWKLAVFMMTAHLYENRGVTTDRAQKPVPYAYECYIHGLRTGGL